MERLSSWGITAAVLVAATLVWSAIEFSLEALFLQQGRGPMEAVEGWTFGLLLSLAAASAAVAFRLDGDRRDRFGLLAAALAGCAAISWGVHPLVMMSGLWAALLYRVRPSVRTAHTLAHVAWAISLIQSFVEPTALLGAYLGLASASYALVWLVFRQGHLFAFGMIVLVGLATVAIGIDELPGSAVALVAGIALLLAAMVLRRPQPA